MRQYWGKTFALGFGFLAISTVWPLYDSLMTEFLARFISSSALIGLIMGLDNFLGLTLQPWIGSLSDRTRSSWGRRRPYLLIGMPVAALALASFPFTYNVSLVTLLLTTGILNLAMSMFRSPTIALMPDLIPPAHRSVANGIINFMGGVGAAIIMLVGKMLYPINPGYPFVAAGGIMILVFVLFLFVIREPEIPAADSKVEETPQSLLLAARSLIRDRDHNAMLLFLAICAWFVGYQSINTWFAAYAEQIFGVTRDKALGTLFYFSVTFIAGALPAGFIGAKFGRRPTIAVGLSGLMLAFAAMHFVTNFSHMTYVMLFAGLCWSLININSFPMVWQMCHPSQTGTYTGLYYIFSGLAGAGGPFLVGLVFDLVGTMRPLFIMGIVFLAIAMVLILSVRKGEADTKAPKAA